MNSKSLRRLAGDHGSLHTAGLPPNYLFPPSSDGSADLTALDVLLAGPVGTPYAGGVWRLHLDIPPAYPAAPPTAQFRTRLWHPNIDEATGAVCVETLKRDWTSSLKLRDVLVTISCLLIQPNPASALNEAAGKLASEDWDTYCRRAKLMTEIHAPVPGSIADQVKEAQMRGEDVVPSAELPTSKTKPVGEDVERAAGLPSASKPRVVAAEDEENTCRRGETQEPESDPESDWIPGPNDTSKAPVMRRENNVFGIRGLEGTMHMDRATRRVFARAGPAVGPAMQEILHDTGPFTTVASKRGVQSSRSLHLCLNTAGPHSAPDVADTPEILKYSHQNPFSAIQPNNQTHPLFRDFSYSWEDARILQDAFPGDGASKDSMRKRMASDDFEAKRSWEMKKFKKAGLDMGRYNRGDFGPRTGVNRL